MTPVVRLPLTAWQRWLQHAANVAVGGTGLVYWWMKEVLEPADEWAMVNHPWQPHVQHLHVLLAPTLVFLVGLVWQRHVAPGWQRGTINGWSGRGMALGFVPMAASGYLVQVSTEEAWRTAWSWLHLVTGILWVVGYGVHVVRGWSVRRRAVRSSVRAEELPAEAPIAKT